LAVAKAKKPKTRQSADSQRVAKMAKKGPFFRPRAVLFAKRLLLRGMMSEFFITPSAWPASPRHDASGAAKA